MRSLKARGLNCKKADGKLLLLLCELDPAIGQEEQNQAKDVKQTGANKIPDLPHRKWRLSGNGDRWWSPRSPPAGRWVKSVFPVQRGGFQGNEYLNCSANWLEATLGDVIRRTKGRLIFPKTGAENEGGKRREKKQKNRVIKLEDFEKTHKENSKLKQKE